MPSRGQRIVLGLFKFLLKVAAWVQLPVMLITVPGKSLGVQSNFVKPGEELLVAREVVECLKGHRKKHPGEDGEGAA